MNVIFSEDKAVFTINNFDPIQTLECGQAFRWRLDGDIYTGIVKDKVLNLSWQDDKIEIYPCNKEDFNNIWKNYFDLNRDYDSIISSFKKDEQLYTAAQFGKGIRILKQDIWETLISFIISANNSIHRIKGIIDKISIKWGSEIKYNDHVYYLFPTADQLSKASIDELMLCGAGYRAESILQAAQRVSYGYDLYALYDTDTKDAREELITFRGIGQKVAECILLYSLGRMDAFPVDTWIKKAMETMYIGQVSNQGNIMKEAERLFGENAGLAQQYLFYYSRMNKINGK